MRCKLNAESRKTRQLKSRQRICLFLWGRFMFLITAHFDYLSFNLFWLSYPEIDSTGNIKVFFSFKAFSKALWDDFFGTDFFSKEIKTQKSLTQASIYSLQPYGSFQIRPWIENQIYSVINSVRARWQATLKWQVSRNEATRDCWLWVKACNHHSSPVGAVLTVTGC